MVDVIQADREVAADYLARRTTASPITVELVRTGEDDNHPLVQAFARHRLSTLPATSTERAELVERLRAWLAKATPGPWKNTPYRGVTCSQVWAGEPGPDAVLICGDGDASDEDAALIVAMHEALPRLLSRSRALDDAREALEPFAKIVPSTLYEADGSDNEEYVVLLRNGAGNPLAFTGADLAHARAALAALDAAQSPSPQGEVTQADFAPCPTCRQYSHSIGEDQLAAAHMHFETMITHPVRGHPMGNAFDEKTRDAAQVLMAAARLSTPPDESGERNAREILAGIKWRSADKDNMEFAARITYVTMDKIRALISTHPVRD